MFCQSHNHATSTDHDIRKLYKVLTIVFFFMSLELWGHYHSNSLSLLADCIHLLVDFLGFIASIAALKWTQKAENEKMSFGYSRIEIIGAIFSIFLIWIATAYLLFESYHKIKNPKEINANVFVTISVIGLAVNIYCLYALHDQHEQKGEHRNLNIRAAYIHIIGDLIQSVGVIIASIITLFNPKWVIVDIICTLCFSVLVLLSTFFVMKDAFDILVEKCPKDIDINKIKEAIMSLDNVKEVIKIHVWSLNANIKVINVHIMLKEIWKYESEMVRSKEILYNDFGFKYVTIEFDTEKTMNFISNKKINNNLRDDRHKKFDVCNINQALIKAVI
ncbi:hypothetical protein COBT_003239 [Conglomerata obtusa]